MKLYPAIAVIIACVCCVSFVQSGLSITAGQDDDDLEIILAEADRYSQKEFDQYNTLTILMKALEEYPDNVEILWRISRGFADSAQVVIQDPDGKDPRKLELYERSLEYAGRAVNADPTHSMAHTRRAIAMGQIALYKGIWDSLDLVKQTRDAIEKAIELDSQNSIAHYVYARTHAAVSERPKLIRAPLGIGWANLDRAIEHFNIAMDLYPEFIMIRLDAARAYLRKKNNQRARELLESIEDLPKLNQLDDHYRMQARELLGSIN
jgi:tetratricopeptide (TPR) repeat protein